MINRDKQFQNFANIVYMECTNIAQEGMLSNRIDTNQRVIRHIARRAYDLVRHAQADPKDLDVLGLDEAIQRIPDMAELPKEQG